MYEKIKEICKIKNIPICKVERDLGFSQGSICKWSSYTPSFDRVVKLANYLEVPIETFVDPERNSTDERK